MFAWSLKGSLRAAAAEHSIKKNDYTRLLLRFSKWLLHPLACWPCTDLPIAIQRTVYGCTMLMCCFICVGLVLHFLEYFSDYRKSLDNISSMSTIFQTVVKLTILSRQSGRLKQILLTTFNNYWPNFLEPDQDEILKRLYKLYMYTIVYLLFCAVFFTAFFVLFPLVETERETPYKSIYPFDWKATPMYQITYAVHFITANAVDCIVVGFDALFMGICFSLTCQYILLGRMFLELGHQQTPLLNEQFSVNQCCPDRSTLVMCIKHMQLLSKTAEHVEKVFNLAAALQLGSSVVAICVSGFIATREDVDAAQIVTMSSYLIGHLVQLFIYCMVGNELHFQSSQLLESIYTSHWNEVHCSKLKKEIIFVLMKSRVPAKITAIKVLTLNYETFMKVVKLSFSFYTVLTAITN